ncbi:MAG: pyrroline-5-carboxylate reductase [Desulfuromonas sp.]|nr:pyrroline-5-carboxylate reductase [Desulfuromonas sp.]
MQQISGTGFIGGGNMAEALIKGLIAAGVAADTLMVAELQNERREYLQRTYGVEVSADSRKVVAHNATVILAVKPQSLEQALRPVADLFSADKCLISILAGVATAKLEALVGDKVPVVRVMPNTPALIGAGAAGISAGRYADADCMELACDLFRCVGVVEVVAESLLDAVTGLSGSGPAYVYMIIEALADGGVLEGLPRATALMLAAQTVAGTAQLLLETKEHPAVLRDRVCSPAGTTIAAVQTLERNGVRAAMIEAVQSAARRSRELG